MESLMPREKLMKYGVDSLEDFELLAILLQTGTKKEGVMDLSKRLIKELDGLDNMKNVTTSDWMKIKGIKESKACKLIAFMEFARRIFLYQKDICYLRTDLEVFEFMKYDFVNSKNEELVVLYVDIQCRLILKKTVAKGNINSVYVDVKDIVSYGMKCNSFGIFLIHNHPSGDVRPSNSDLEITKNIITACKLFNIIVLDHLIIGVNKYYSFNNNHNL